MKPTFRTVIGASVVVLTMTALAVGQGRKLPEGAYIKSAKIELGYQDTVRCPAAIAMLDSLMMHYGPHAEGYALMTGIWNLYIEKSSSLQAKELYAKKYATYLDSLKSTCVNPSVKAKYKDKCQQLIAIADSTKVQHWRTFYNESVVQMNKVDTALRQIASTQDTSLLADYKAQVTAAADSAAAYCRLAIYLDSVDSGPYLVMGTVCEKQKQYDSSSAWLARGLRYAKDSTQILIQMAYNAVFGDQYEKAIPLFQQYLKLVPNDTANLFNLSICYNNAKMYDSAVAVYRQLLVLDPKNVDALIGMGHYYNQMATNANDSANKRQSANDDKGAKRFSDLRTTYFDSAHTFLKEAYVINPNDASIAEDVAVVSAILNKYDEAAEAFAKLGQMEPNKVSHWSSLGECYIQLKKWSEAVAAYEKAVELEPDNRQNLQQLRDLYGEVDMKEKQAAIDKKLK